MPLSLAMLQLYWFLLDDSLLSNHLESLENLLFEFKICSLITSFSPFLWDAEESWKRRSGCPLFNCPDGWKDCSVTVYSDWTESERSAMLKFLGWLKGKNILSTSGTYIFSLFSYFLLVWWFWFEEVAILQLGDNKILTEDSSKLEILWLGTLD